MALFVVGLGTGGATGVWLPGNPEGPWRRTRLPRPLSSAWREASFLDFFGIVDVCLG